MFEKSIDHNHLHILKKELQEHVERSRELLRDIMMNYEDVIRVLIKIVEEKDSYTKGHSENVTKLAVKLAQKLGLNEDQVHEIKEASLLHDIGKIAIDKEILNKPGPLTEEECRKIKEHPEIGARIVGQSHAFKNLISGIRHHHEKYSGGGYPNPNLKKRKIPLYARIISIADAWDAMRSDRAYRRALSREEAISEIHRCSGDQFDPEIVPVFLGLV